MIIREIVDTLEIRLELRCEVCGISYRADRYDAKCPLCLNGIPTEAKHLPRYVARGNRLEQAERMERVYQLYKEKYPEMGDKATGYIARAEKLKLQTVQAIIRRRRGAM